MKNLAIVGIVILLIVSIGVALMLLGNNPINEEDQDGMNQGIESGMDAEEVDDESQEEELDESMPEDEGENTDELAAGTTHTFEVRGSHMAFDVKEMRVKKGDTVNVVFVNEGGMHDWVIDEFDAATPIISAGETAEVTFVADKEGEFEYYCSFGNHRAAGMVGTLIVE